MGFPIESFVNKEVDEELICSICQQVLQNPVILDGCEHLFCKECLDDWIKNSRTCPIDRIPIPLFATLRPAPRPIRNMLHNLDRKCKFYDASGSGSGCVEIVKVGNFESHLQTCQHNPNPTRNNPSIPIPNEKQTMIWEGVLEWREKRAGLQPGGQRSEQLTYSEVNCQVSTNVINDLPEVKGDGWPHKMIMQLIPKVIVENLGGNYFIEAEMKTVLFTMQQNDALDPLRRMMESGFLEQAGFIHFSAENGTQSSICGIKVIILIYNKERRTYSGLIPNDQNGFVDQLRTLIKQRKAQQQTLRDESNQVPVVPLSQLIQQNRQELEAIQQALEVVQNRQRMMEQYD